MSIADGYLILFLWDDRILSVPLAWYPRLADATPEELAQWTIFAEGTAIEWPSLDEHIGVDGLLAGRRSQESAESLSRWRGQRARTSQQVSAKGG